MIESDVIAFAGGALIGAILAAAAIFSLDNFRGKADRCRIDLIENFGLSVGLTDKGLWGLVRKRDGRSEIVGQPGYDLRDVIDRATKELETN